MKCSFCGNTIRHGRGKMFVKNDGSIYFWCSSKCEKNFKIGKDKKKLKWSKPKK